MSLSSLKRSMVRFTAVADVFIVLWPITMCAVQMNDFFPYGVNNNDSVMIRSDDGSSPRLNLSIAIPFYGYQYDSLWVNVNGALSFLSVIPPKFVAACTGVKQNYILISPFWSDIDISSTGNIYYRETFDAAVLEKANNEISGTFSDSLNIRLKWAFVVTWFNVTYYPDNTNSSRPRNTFQVVLTTDGVKSFFIFYYNSITWTTTTTSLGYPAMAGFDVGNSFFQIPGSCTSDIITIVDRSNVGSPGKWMFRVDNSSSDVSAGCFGNFTGDFCISPSFVNSYGHVPIEITIPFVEAVENATCRFYDPNGNITDAPAVILENRISLKLGCGTPFFYTIGRLRLDAIVFTNATQRQFTGNLYVIMPTESNADLQVSVEQSPNRTDSLVLKFKWDPTIFGSKTRSVCDKIDVAETIYEKLEDLNGIVGWAEEGFTIIFEADVPVSAVALKLGELAIDILIDELKSKLGCGTIHDLKTKVVFALMKIGCEAISDPLAYGQQAIFNTFTTTAKLFGDVCSPPARRAMCEGWLAVGRGVHQGQEKVKELGAPPNLPPCPPTSALAAADFRFVPDSSCESSSLPPPQCFYNPGVDSCFRSVGGDGRQQCCYKGGRIKLGSPGGGTSSSYSPADHAGIPHSLEDQIPWVACCYEQPESLCQKYYDKRPSNPATNYSAPVPAAASGDPHITTFDLLSYTFNGAGEFWMLKNNSMQPVSLQARMEQWIGGRKATLLTALVMKDRSSSVIQVQKSTDRPVDVLVDGIALDLTVPALRTLQLDGVYITVSDDFTAVSVAFASGIAFEIATPWAFALTTYLSKEYKGQKTHGLLGTYDGNPRDDLNTPNGTIIPITSSLEYIHHNFGMTWLVNETDSLFSYGSKKYSDYYFPDFLPNFDYPDASAPDPNDVCSRQRDCLYDLNTTGNAAVASQTKNFADVFNNTVNQFSQNISLCPVLNNPGNGSCQVPNYFPHSLAIFSCFDGFHIVGDNPLICQDTYTWNGTAPVCSIDSASTDTTLTSPTTISTTISVAITPSAEEENLIWLWILIPVLLIVVFIIVIVTVVLLATKRHRRHHHHHHRSRQSNRYRTSDTEPGRY